MSQNRARLQASDQPVQPAPDYGFFEPDSVARRVWSYPTSIVVGFARAVTIEHLDPLLAAAVIASGQVKQRTPLRFDRTMQYFATVLYGDAASVVKSSEILIKIHTRSVGTDEVTGATYDANDPDSQMWIHLTAWHSILISYEVFGPGKLSPEDEAKYWQECVVAAKLQTIDVANMPCTREDVVAYFEAFRPKMVMSDGAQDMFRFLVNMHRSSLPDDVPAWIRHPMNALASRAIVATMPRWMREMGGTPQSRAVDVATIAVLKPLLRALHRSPWTLRVLQKMSPRTYPILAPYLRDVKPVQDKVWDVGEAQAEFGSGKTPRELYAEQLEARAVGDGVERYRKDHHDPLLAFDTAGEAGGTLTR